MRRLAAVVLAALVLAPAAFAHAELSPTTIRVGRTATLTLAVPTESDTAATVGVTVRPARGLTLGGETSWHGRSRGTVRLRLTARADTAGPYPIEVRQVYSDGTVVTWSGPEASNTPAPVVHVESPQNANRDRAVIVVIAAALLLLWYLLRRRRVQRLS